MSQRERLFLQPRVLIPFIVITLIWGSTWLVITTQLGIVPPSWSVVYRFAIGAAAMFVYAAATGASLRIGRSGHWLALLFGIPQFCLNYNFVYFAEQRITSGLVALIFALLFVPNAFLARVFLRQRLGGRFVAGSIVAVAGVALLFVHEIHAPREDSHHVLAGVLLSLAAVAAASVANVIQAGEPMRIRSLPAMTAWGMFYGVLANLVIAVVGYGPPVMDTSALYLAGLLYLGVAGSALAFSLYFAIIRIVGPAPAAYSSLLIPLVAMILSTIFEAYHWSPTAAAGAILALAGLAIALRGRRGGAAERASGAMAGVAPQGPSA